MQKIIAACCWLLVTTVIHAQQLSWYKCLAGKIGKYSITMHLHKKGHSYTGWYYYNSEQRPVEIDGDDTTRRNAVVLRAYPEDAGEDDNEKFEFTQTDESFAGTWERNDKSSPLIFSAETVTGMGLINFQFIYTYGTRKLKPAMKNSPEASFEEATIWPVGFTPGEDTIRKILYGDSSIKKAGVGDILLENKRSYFDDYRADTAELDPSDLKEFPQSYNRRSDASKTVVFQSSHLLTVADYNNEYRAGLHANYGTIFTSINLLTNKKLVLEDIVTAKGKAMLPDLLAKHFKIDHHVTQTTSLTDANLFVDTIDLDEGVFFVTGKGMGFSYVPTELGPRSMGQITIFIPFSELGAGLQEEFKGLL